MKEYEEVVHKYYSTLKVNGLPSSWDIYSTYFSKLCYNYKDVQLLTDLADKNNWTHVLDLNNDLINKEQVIVVTDAELNIVHATKNIHAMNGYMPDEIIGKKPKMFQGVGTSKETTAYISKAVKNKSSFEATILNYRKDGTPYNCYIKGSPVFNEKGKLINFIAYEREVA